MREERKGSIMYNTDINIASVIFFENQIVANLDCDHHLLFCENVTEEIHEKVINKLTEKGIPFIL